MRRRKNARMRARGLLEARRESNEGDRCRDYGKMMWTNSNPFMGI